VHEVDPDTTALQCTQHQQIAPANAAAHLSVQADQSAPLSRDPHVCTFGLAIRYPRLSRGTGRMAGVARATVHATEKTTVEYT
jgi:hypothetical protein